MSDLHNPLFEEEKEFLERKKLEYERALRGDVNHIKEQSIKVGKVALVGAGLVSGIWLITKAFGSKKRKRNHYVKNEDDYGTNWDLDRDEDDLDNEFGDDYYTAGNGQRYKSTKSYRSAADSTQAFIADDEHDYEDNDLGFRSTAPGLRTESALNLEQYAADGEQSLPHEPSPYDTEDFEDDPFQDLPYDDSRRLPTSHAFDGQDTLDGEPQNSRSRMLGSVLQAFLTSDTGKVLVGQAAAVALALVTKKLSEFFPADKNSDLAASPEYAPAETGFAPVASLASPDSPDASNHSQSL
ncbi:hypothetical protein [Hymenobacter terrenus]|uniref:hypothetical protein n=1 Tax=Hymenobacter terrenus TaxID=1629124 RepID=UPI000698C14C|nr:hypothetical protein [Hymenobacter terrenus]